MISLATQFLDLSYDTETLLETLDIVHEINKSKEISNKKVYSN